MELSEDPHQRYCRNCHHPLPPEAKYCPQCSQKYTTGKIAIGSFLKEFFTTIFNFDSKIFLTLRDLLFPGKLTKEYFKGRHKSYLHPLRLFLVTALAHFAIIGFYIGSENAFSTSLWDSDAEKKAYNQDFVTSLDSNQLLIQQKFMDSTVNAAFDSLNLNIKKQFPIQDSIDISYDIFGGKPLAQGNNIKDKDISIAYKDYIELSPNELLDKYQIEGFWQRLLATQLIKVTKRGGNFSSFIFGKLTWMTLFMMPVLALILKLLYVRRKKYYVEHLVFSFHYHSFAFILVSLMVLFSNFLPVWSIPISFLVIMLYLFKAMRKVYDQSRFKTFLKFSPAQSILFNIVYLVFSAYFCLWIFLILKFSLLDVHI